MPTLQRVTRISLCCSAVLLAACAKKDDTAADTLAASTTASTTSTAPAPINLADVAGKWDMTTVPVSGDTTPTHYVLTATNNTEGWTITFPGRPPVPLTIAVEGDSITSTSAEYQSVRRKGVKVRTTGGWRLQNGNLVGTTIGHYAVKTADSLQTFTSTGTRAK